MARISETVYIVASPDGTSEEFASAGEAQTAQAARPGSQLRSTTRQRDVPADYVVMVGDEELSRHSTAAEAGRQARSTPGAVVVIMPAS